MTDQVTLSDGTKTMCSLLISPQEYEQYSGRSFRADFDERILRRKEREEISKQNKKNPIPESVKWAVWERDNFTCKKCGSRQRLSVDHIYPEALGGESKMENYQTLCRRCNSLKGKRI